MRKKVIKQTSIKKQIMVRNVFLLILVVVLLVASSVVIARRALIDSSSELLTSFAKQVGQDIGRVIELEASKVEAVAESHILRDKNLDLQTKLDYLSGIVKDQNYKKAAIIDLNGNCVTTAGETINVSDRDYFKQNLKGNTSFGSPVVSRVDGGLQISITTPIYDYDGNMIDVLFFSKDAESFCQITNNIKFAATGTAYVVDENGTNIMNIHIEKVKDQVNTIEDAKEDSSYNEIAEITKKMISGESGTARYNFEGETKFLGYAPVENTKWSVGIVCNISDMLSGMNQLAQTLIIIGILSLIIMIILSYFIANKISKRLIKLKNEVEEISTGNFKAKEVNEKINDEITEIYKSLESTKKSVGNIINVIKESTIDLNEESVQLKNVSEIFLEGTSNIRSSIEQAAKGTENQANELTQINVILGEFDAKLNQSNRNISNINEKATDISDRAEKSCNDMQELSQFIINLNRSFTNFAKGIVEMKQQMEKINDITELISYISDQANLLSLNAAIEAARAGEAGKGFSVDVDEIGNLSEKTKEFASNINEVISNLISRTKNIVESGDEVALQLVSGEKNVENSISSFERILNNVGEVTNMIKIVNKNFVEVIKQKDEIVDKVEEASSVSEEMVATSEEVLASTNEFVESSKDVKKATDKLSELTSNMEESVNKFEI